MTETYLYEFDQIEWFDIVRRLWPDMEHREFERMWAEFCLMKEQRVADGKILAQSTH